MTTKDNGFRQRDIEMIERVLSRQVDDIAVSLARSFERLDERIDAVESRLQSRIADVADNLVTYHNGLGDEFEALRSDLREHLKEEAPIDSL